MPADARLCGASCRRAQGTRPRAPIRGLASHAPCSRGRRMPAETCAATAAATVTIHCRSIIGCFVGLRFRAALGACVLTIHMQSNTGCRRLTNPGVRVLRNYCFPSSFGDWRAKRPSWHTHAGGDLRNKSSSSSSCSYGFCLSLVRERASVLAGFSPCAPHSPKETAERGRLGPTLAASALR